MVLVSQPHTCPANSSWAWWAQAISTREGQLGEGRQGLGRLSICLSTHHRGQSLFPRLKPSQLKSSKLRAAGAIPPPVEETDRCSHEGGPEEGACPTPLPTRGQGTCIRSPGPRGQARTRPWGGQDGDQAGGSCPEGPLPQKGWGALADCSPPMLYGVPSHDPPQPVTSVTHSPPPCHLCCLFLFLPSK